MEDKSRKEYKRNEKKIEYILGHEELNTVLSKDNQKVVQRAFDVMVPNMYVFAETDKVAAREVTAVDKSSVKEALNLLLNVVIRTSLRPILKDLVLEFGLYAFNWNKAYGKRPDIDEVIVLTRDVTEGTLSLIKAIDIIKGLTRRVESLEKFSPPAFELSRHYLKTLGEKD